MADETTDTTPAGQDPAAGQEPGGETFDEARAKALIAKLRDEVKATKGEARELAELRQARKTADEAALTEQQKLAKRAADLEAENTRISAEALADRTNAHRARRRRHADQPGGADQGRPEGQALPGRHHGHAGTAGNQRDQRGAAGTGRQRHLLEGAARRLHVLQHA